MFRLYSDEFQTITSRDGNVPAVVNEERAEERAKERAKEWAKERA